jgi:hypothetical protein
MPSLESEARNMVAGLITFLKHLHGNEVLEFFTKDALDSFWDKKEQCVRNKDDDHVSSLLNDIDDDYILPPVIKVQPLTSKHPSRFDQHQAQTPFIPFNGILSGMMTTPSTHFAVIAPMIQPQLLVPTQLPPSQRSFLN